MGQRQGITIQGVGWWPIWGHHQTWAWTTHSAFQSSLGHLDIRGFTQRSLGQQVWVHLDQNHRPRFSSAEANRASDRPGCNLDNTCSTNLKEGEGQKTA